MPPRLLPIFEALPPYLGGKRRLLRPIFCEIARHLDPSTWRSLTFIDGFAGGCSASLYAKARFGDVLANDLAERSAVIAHGLLENNATRLKREDALLLLAGGESPTNWAQTQPEWFLPAVARFLDRGLAYADALRDRTKREMLRMVLWRIAAKARPAGGDATSKDVLARAFSGELSSNFFTGAPFALGAPTLGDILSLFERTNKGVFAGRARFSQDDAVVASAGWGGEVVYLDPPYAGDQTYEKYYRLMDAYLAQGNVPPIVSSPFSDPQRAEAVLEQIVANVASAGARVLAWSNCDEGLSRERQLSLVGKHFDCYEVPVHHAHTNAGQRGPKRKSALESGASEVLIVGFR